MTTLCSVYSVTTLDVHSTSVVHQDINLHTTQETQWQHCVCTLSQHWMYTLPALFTSISIYTRHKRRNDNTVCTLSQHWMYTPPALFTRISIYTWHKRHNDNTVCVLCHNTGCTLYQHCSPGYQSTHDTRDTMTTLCVYSVTALDVHSTSIVDQDINLHMTQETQWQHCVCVLCHNTGCTLYQHCSPVYQSTQDTRDVMTTLCSVYSVTTLDVHSTSIVHQDINLHMTQETQWQHCVVCTLSQHWMYTLPALFTRISIYTRHKRRNDNTV